MIVDWSALDEELVAWSAEGLKLPLWWRDDDAVEPTPQLVRLSDLSENLGIPIHLAVVPAHATLDLSRFLQTRSHIIPVVHGWAHYNHAPADEKKAEFRLHRPLEDLVSDVINGHERLIELFGEMVMPMFVPPWNRIDSDVVRHLPAAGFKVLSTATPRKSLYAAPGLLQINAHLDPIDWRGTRSLASPDQLIKQLVQQLRDRRMGVTDNTEPYGLLTHHLVHDEDIWSFTEDVLSRLLDGPGRCWTIAETSKRTLPHEPT